MILVEPTSAIVYRGSPNLEMRREEILPRHFPRMFRSKSVARGSAHFEHDGLQLQPEGPLRRSARSICWGVAGCSLDRVRPHQRAPETAIFFYEFSTFCL